MSTTLTLIIIATAALEVLTITGRLIYGPYNEIHRKSGAKIRIHHGYLGILLLSIYFIVPSALVLKEILIVAGSSLLVSDALHHFIVLPIWVGKTEFPN